MFCFNVHAPHFVIFIIELRGDDDDDDERERERATCCVIIPRKKANNSTIYKKINYFQTREFIRLRDGLDIDTSDDDYIMCVMFFFSGGDNLECVCVCGN